MNNICCNLVKYMSSWDEPGAMIDACISAHPINDFHMQFDATAVHASTVT